MKYLFKQKMFSILDKYDIFDESGDVAYTIKGRISIGHKFEVFDKNDNKVGMLEQDIFHIMPHFRVFEHEEELGQIFQKFALFKPKFEFDFKGWTIDGDFFQWDYDIKNNEGVVVATISKELFHLTDHYSIDVKNNEDALKAIMIALAIDAAKCSSGNT